MTVFLGILSFFAILASLILVHELGHFSFARIMGIRVDEFGLGFPPRVKSWRRNGTLYSLNAIPLGGFVKMRGENGEATEPDSFGAKPPWQRFLVLVAGPGMNLLFALLIFTVAFMLGYPRSLTYVTGVAPGSPAQMAGLQPGDRIVAIDSRPVRYADELVAITNQHLGEPVRLRVRRGSTFLTTSLVPRPQGRRPADQGPIGIRVEHTATMAYGPGEAVRRAVQELGAVVALVPAILQSVGNHGSGQISGPIGIAHITTTAVQNEPQQGPGSIFELMAILSANLGVLNLLPIPALDGGRIAFVLLSWARRRNLDPELEGVIHLVGMAMLLLLIAVVSYQDIARWLSGSAF